jgi:sec-independent protein translocase protein TatA
MGSMSLMHWLVVLAIVLVLFGAGKLPRVMGDFAKGIKAFKAGMKEEDETTATVPPAQVTAAGTPAMASTVTPSPATPSSVASPTVAAGGATVAPQPHEHA